jgi:hypothetical protein
MNAPKKPESDGGWMLLEFGSSMDAGPIRNPGLELQSSSSEATRSKFLHFWGFEKENRFSTTNVHQDRLSCTAHGTAWHRIVDIDRSW